MHHWLFPFELSTFLAGALSHRYLLPVARRLVEQSKNRLDIVVTSAAVTALVAGMVVQQYEWTAYPVLYARCGCALLFAFVVPFLFIFHEPPLPATN